MRRALLVLLASPVAAEEPREVPGETIVITGEPEPRPIDETTAAVTVIDRDAIARSPHTLVDELVREMPSVGTFRRSASLVADPTSQGLNLRGVGPSAVSRALVLRDGVPLNDPFGGWIYWRALSPLGIERVEIVPSGASARYGNFALGGVVDMISRPIEPAQLEAVIAGGSLATGRGALRATDRRGSFGVAVEIETFRTGGYTPVADPGPIDHDADSAHTSGGARIEYAGRSSTTHVDARWFAERLDAGTDFTTAEVAMLTYGVGWQYRRARSRLQVELFGGDQDFAQTRARVAPDRSSASLASEQHTPSNHQGALVSWSMRPNRRIVVAAGADGRRVEGSATDEISPFMPTDDSLVERVAGGEQYFAGIYGQSSLRVTAAVELAAALRLDAWQNRAGHRSLLRTNGEREDTTFDPRSEVQLDPRLGALVRASEHVALRGSIYRAFRAPTLNELYRPFQVGTILTAANAELRPETLWGAEAGPQITVDGIVVRATAFYNLLDGAIANVTVAEGMRQRQNLGAARVAGLELDATWRPHRHWELGVAQTFVDAEVVSAPAQPELVGKRLPQDPRFRATGSLAFDDPRIVTAAAQVRYLGPMFEDDMQQLPIGAVVLVDARIARRLGRRLELFLAAQNLFDRRYLVGRAGVDTLGAPRTFELGLAYANR